MAEAVSSASSYQPSAETLGVFAIPFIINGPQDAPKLQYILDRACEHRPWFPDHIWNDPPSRRSSARAYLADTFSNGRVWEVWRGNSLLGILLLTDVEPGMNAQCHFLFFDHELRNKRRLCLNVMTAVFEEYGLHALRVEVPECFAKYCGFLRKGLGFRYESERWLAPSEAKKASRKYQATMYEGQWQDVLLLSVTSQEFATFVRLQAQEAGQQPHGPVSGSTWSG